MKHIFLLSVEANESYDKSEIFKSIQDIIDVGQADASESLDDDPENEDAELASSLEISLSTLLPLEVPGHPEV